MHTCTIANSSTATFNPTPPRIKHNHMTRDIKSRGVCPACDAYWFDQEEEEPYLSAPDQPVHVDQNFLDQVNSIRAVEPPEPLELDQVEYDYVERPFLWKERMRRLLPSSAIDELVEAIRLTVEYTGNDVLPAKDGWSWYDALVKYAPDVAQQFRSNPIHFPKPPTDRCPHCGLSR